jgi:hypothetical protein
LLSRELEDEFVREKIHKNRQINHQLPTPFPPFKSSNSNGLEKVFFKQMSCTTYLSKPSAQKEERSIQVITLSLEQNLSEERHLNTSL